MENGHPKSIGRTKLDKIFDNTYGENELENKSNFTYLVDPVYDNRKSLDEDIHFKLLYSVIETFIDNNNLHKQYNDSKERNDFIKLNKLQINDLFNLTVNQVSGYTYVEIWTALSDYFDIYPNKFYNSLSNKFKDVILTELENKKSLSEKYNIRNIY